MKTAHKQLLRKFLPRKVISNLELNNEDNVEGTLCVNAAKRSAIEFKIGRDFEPLDAMMVDQDGIYITTAEGIDHIGEFASKKRVPASRVKVYKQI